MCDLVWGDLMSPPHCTPLRMKNHRINFWVWTRANGGLLYYVHPSLSSRDSVSTCLQQTLNAKNASRSALDSAVPPQKLRHLCTLGEWCLFAVPAPLLASAPSVLRAVRVTPSWSAALSTEHLVTQLLLVPTHVSSPIAVNSAAKREVGGQCPGSFRSYFGFIVPVIRAPQTECLGDDCRMMALS